MSESNNKVHGAFEVTPAINDNPIASTLLDKYYNILVGQFNIKRIVIFKEQEGGWECVLTTDDDMTQASRIDVEKDLLPVRDITFVSVIKDEQIKNKLADLGFEIVIPISDKNKLIAYVLIGGDEEEKEKRKAEIESVDPVLRNFLIQSISDVILITIDNFRLYHENLRQEAIRKELELASRMQYRLIPSLSSLPRNERIVMNAFYKPHYEIGGDYFDCIRMEEDRIGFCVADVSGKGIPAALLMSNFQATLRALFTSDIPLDKLVYKLNTHILNSVHGEEFITLFIARYDYATQQMEYINCGHTPSILYQIRTEEVQLLESGCPGLGMLDELPVVRVETVTITEHSLLLNYTDGLVELLSNSEDGVSSSFGTVLCILQRTTSIDEAIGKIIEKQKLNQFNRRIFDDVTLLGVEFLCAEPPAE